MNNPNVAQGSSSTPNMLDTVGAPFMCSATEAVRATPYVFGEQDGVAAQPAMAPVGNQPSFEKLMPKSMPTTSGPMGTDYKNP